jgi:hypothetical protein
LTNANLEVKAQIGLSVLDAQRCAPIMAITASNQTIACDKKPKTQLPETKLQENDLRKQNDRNHLTRPAFFHEENTVVRALSGSRSLLEWPLFQESSSCVR